jgi:hypothetical protein
MRYGILRRRGRTPRPLLGLIPAIILVAFTASGCTKMIGGGWIPSVDPAEKATFGFVAKCDTVTMGGLPAAVLHEGQFEFKDPALDVNVHGDVEPAPLQTFPGMTCKQLAESEPNLLGTGAFVGRFQTQNTAPMTQGEFFVQVFDGGKPGTIDGDEICVDLAGDGAGGLVYPQHCGEVQGGNIRIE